MKLFNCYEWIQSGKIHILLYVTYVKSPLKNRFISSSNNVSHLGGDLLGSVRLDVDASFTTGCFLIFFPILSKLYLDATLHLGFTFGVVFALFALSLSFCDTLAFLFLVFRCAMRREQVDTLFDCEMYPTSLIILLISLLVMLLINILEQYNLIFYDSLLLKTDCSITFFQTPSGRRNFYCVSKVFFCWYTLLELFLIGTGNGMIIVKIKWFIAVWWSFFGFHTFVRRLHSYIYICKYCFLIVQFT